MLVGWGLLLGRDLASPFHGAPKPHCGYHLDRTQNRSLAGQTVGVSPLLLRRALGAGLRELGSGDCETAFRQRRRHDRRPLGAGEPWPPATGSRWAGAAGGSWRPGGPVAWVSCGAGYRVPGVFTGAEPEDGGGRQQSVSRA